MATQNFSIKFDGPALAEGRMRVEELAPALIALGELFQYAREIEEPNAPSVHLEVSAVRPGGSLEGFLALTSPAVAILAADPISALTNLMTLVTHGRSGVVAALRALRGMKITRAEQRSGGLMEAFNNAGDSFIAPFATFNIYNFEPARDAAARFVRPLAASGVDELEVRSDVAEPLELTKPEVEAIEEAEEDELVVAGDPVVDQELELLVTPIALSFKDTNKWRLDIGDGKIVPARIEDEGYLGRIHRQEVGFVEGDTMFVRMRMRQWENKKTEWTVLEVVRHHHPQGKTLPLPFDEGDQS